MRILDINFEHKQRLGKPGVHTNEKLWKEKKNKKQYITGWNDKIVVLKKKTKHYSFIL